MWGNWLYDHSDVRAEADEIRARIRRDAAAASLARRSSLEEAVKAENRQLLQRNRILVQQLKAVEDLLAEVRCNALAARNGDPSHAERSMLRDRVGELTAANHRLTIEVDTARLESAQLYRDVRTLRDALAQAER